MTITSEISLRNFEFWSGARYNASMLTCEQLDTVESMLEDIAPEDGWTDTAINDMFWFDFDTILEWLGLDEDGNEIGSDEWAEKVLYDKIEDTDPVHHAGSFKELINKFIEEEYVAPHNNDEDDLISDFKMFCLKIWQQRIIQKVQSETSFADEDDIQEWLDDNYYDAYDIPDCDRDIVNEYLEYAKSNNGEE